MISAVIAIILISLAGYFVVASLLPVKGVTGLLLCGSLAPLVGIGLSSITAFFSALVFDGLSLEALVVDFLMLCAIILIAIWHTMNNKTESVEFTQQESAGQEQLLLYGLIGLVVLSLLRSLVEFYFHAMENPHGWWDAKMIWNSRARFLFHPEVGLSHPFTVDPFGHADYPLLIPLTVTQLWNLAGDKTLAAPQIIGVVFYLSSIAMLFTTLLILRGWTVACFGVIVLSQTGMLAQQSAWQLADVPLAAFYLASVSCLVISKEFAPLKLRMILLGGFFAGCAAWTKNEGIVFAGIVFTSFLTQFMFAGKKENTDEQSQNRLASLKEAIAAIMAGASFPFVAVLLFKLTLAPQSDLADDQSLATITAKITDLSRYQTVLQGAWLTMVYPQGSMLRALLWPGLFMVAVSICLGAGPKNLMRNWMPVCIMLLTSLAYFAVYIISPRDLGWHVGTSISRLAIQLWPTWVFSVLILTGCESRPATEFKE